MKPGNSDVTKRLTPMLLLLLVISGGASGAGSPAGSEANPCGMPGPLFERMDHLLSASGTLDYDGTLLVENGRGREFIAVSSAADAASFRRLTRVAGDPSRPIAPIPAEYRTPCSLARSYGLVVEAAAGVVAGRATYRLTARPRDNLRFAYVMDVDAELHLPLRVLTVSPDGKVLELYEFADVTIQPRTAALFVPEREESAAYRLATIPPGFELISEGNAPVDYLVLSDGLTNVSVFIEGQPRSLPSGEGVALRGATLTYTRGTANDRLITVLGEIPVPTARLLADAVRPREGS